MIVNLRRRIVAINVVLVSLIMFVAVIATFSMGFSRINGERDKRLKSALEFDPTQNVPDETVFNDIVFIKYDTEAKEIVGWYFGNGANLSQEYISDKVQNIVQSKDDNGWIGGKLRYAKVEDGNFVKITVNSLEGKNSGIPVYTGIVLGAMFLGLVGYLIISLVLSKIALKPVEESWNKQKQFVADASHELKTPLSVIMANTEIIASHQEETVASQMRWIENTRSEAKRMADLVADLLFLAKNDDGLKVQTEDTDFSDCVNTIVLGYEAIFYENGKAFRYDIAPDVRVTGNAAQLKQLATILLDNANKYSKGEGNIELRLQASGKHVTLTVSNDSEQLTEEQVKHLFDRFYTVDLSRNRSSGGNGLGLSIAQAICQTHGGDISVHCENSRTAFTATLPLKRSKKDSDK
ncbi:MAG: HAMP domain-containing histidine kinase [Corallococcus sp.]|nr:HAMP domain-containing histidine kinase [Corallococcus sp.]MCM1360066.1 HAMP domain-containing histidine kinase [Corallococcus sp.]MCM1395623.1 HAMP domain-containing histidine kinase [Corallococcus sp.]